MDRCQPGIAGPHGVAPTTFEMVEEGGDHRGVEILYGKGGRGLLGLLFDVAEEKVEGVAIGGHGVRARLSLGHQPLGEEGLEGGGQRAHDRASVACSTRSAAKPSSSGAADKYQYVLAG